MLLNFIKKHDYQAAKKHNENLHKVHLQVIAMHACTALASKVFRTQKIIIKDFYLQSLSPLKKIATHSPSKLRDLIFFWVSFSYFLLLLQLMKGNNEFDCNGTKISELRMHGYLRFGTHNDFWTISESINCNLSTKPFLTSNLSWQHPKKSNFSIFKY